MKAIIIADNSHIGHLSHTLAWYNLFTSLGYDSYLYLHPVLKKHVSVTYKLITSDNKLPNNIDVALVYAPSVRNIPNFIKLRLKGCNKILYVFHEPIDNIKPFKDAGFAKTYILKLYLSNIYETILTYLASLVILSSKRAVNQYLNNSLYKKNSYRYIPLLFDDEYTQKLKRSKRVFFSYIGTIAADHSFNEYLRFVEWAITNNKLDGIKFKVATKSTFEIPDSLRNSDRFVVQLGTPLSNEEINEHYCSTNVVWNAYARTTQSGVLAKSFMFGTPALVMRNNLNEFTHDGENIVAIDDNTNFNEIEAAVTKIRDNFEYFSANCRKEFEKSFYYKVYNEQFKRIIDGEG